MTPGKLSAQSGHAYESTILNAIESNPVSVNDYKVNQGGSKVTLEAKNQNQLLRAYNECIGSGIPCSIVIDSQHIMIPHFTGEPVITALGIGPCTKAEAKHITKRYNCVK